MRPAIAYLGGKNKLLPKLMTKIPNHEVYVEEFTGGGSLFLKKPLAKKNIINDKDKDVIKVYKFFKNKDGFMKCDMKGSKIKFNKIIKKNKKSACDIVYLNKWSYGSKSKSYAINGNKNRSEAFKKRWLKNKNKKDFGIKYQQQHREDYKEKMKNTIITNEDFKKIAKKYDSKKTFHYMDPPYVVGGNSYKVHGVTPKEVCDVAKSLDGKVLISYDNRKEVRKACRGLHIKKVTTSYTLGADSNKKKAKELLISNY